MEREQLYHLHWYKELRSKEDRLDLYNIARRLGIAGSVAGRLRDISEPHFWSWLRSSGVPEDVIEKEKYEYEVRKADRGG